MKKVTAKTAITSYLKRRKTGATIDEIRMGISSRIKSKAYTDGTIARTVGYMLAEGHLHNTKAPARGVEGKYVLV